MENRSSHSSLLTPCGHIVRSLREGQGLTLDALVGRVTGTGGQLSKRKLQQIEKSEPTRSAILADLAVALDVDVSTLTFDIEGTTRSLIEQLYVRHETTAIELNRSTLSKDIVLSIAGNPNTIPFAGEYTGIEGVHEFFSRLFAVIENRKDDPPPRIVCLAADYATSTVVVDLEDDLLRHKKHPERTLNVKAKCTFKFQNAQLVFFEDMLDTAAWERFLADP